MVEDQKMNVKARVVIGLSLVVRGRSIYIDDELIGSRMAAFRWQVSRKPVKPGEGDISF